MTDFDRVKAYYSIFPEENRFKMMGFSGIMEYEMTMRIFAKYMGWNKTVLDLGGGAGVYSIPLAKAGHKVYLADLSERLIEVAKKADEDKLLTCNVVNATDLSIYEDSMFDTVLLMGPLYHLLEAPEREQCVRECYRVLKKGGRIFASFIPYLSGSIGIVERYIGHPEQVDINNLKEVFASGKFRNNANSGFQEGYYPTSKEIEKLFDDCGFSKLEIRSIRGFGNNMEEYIYKIEDEVIRNEIFSLIEKTASDESIVEMCSHAMYIGEKKENI